MTTPNLALARHNMIEQQIRPWDVLDQRILELLDSLPREAFVPAAYTGLAYADINIPLQHGEMMMAPKLEARMLQALNIQPGESGLEIGTGSGYVTALLARCAKQVYSVDIHADFTEQARHKLAAHGIGNVQLEVGDASRGWEIRGPYDAVAVTGSLPVLPDSLRRALKIGGRLFVVTGDAPVMTAHLITRVGEESWSQHTLFETVLPPLINAPQPPRFVF
ncbi:MAG: protein-L-isoaspartate O-methyltransferase [Pseudomonadota bacterium]